MPSNSEMPAAQVTTTAMVSDQIVTDEDMRAQVLMSLAGRHGGFDVQAIVSEVQATYGLVRLNVIDSESYWDLVQRHAL